MCAVSGKKRDAPRADYQVIDKSIKYPTLSLSLVIPFWPDVVVMVVLSINAGVGGGQDAVILRIRRPPGLRVRCFLAAGDAVTR